MDDTLKQPAALSGGLQCAPVPSPIAPHLLGHAQLTPNAPVEAGSWQTFTLIYTAGRYGIDDSGSLRFCFRFAADYSKPQLGDATRPGYTTVTASNNAVLECRFDQKGNVRPFDHTLFVKVVNGYLRAGDTITVVFGERGGGSPGFRVQTFVEETFEFHVLVDPLATFNFQSLPQQPEIAVVPGAPARYLLTLPSRVVAGEPFALGLKAEDAWGNPTDRSDTRFALRASAPVAGLPETLRLGTGRTFLRLDGLVTETTGPVEFTLLDPDGAVAARQRVLVTPAAALRSFWADFHAQSEETVGTGTAERYFAFARDEAMLDIASHQGNDFQITEAFWRHLNGLTAAFNVPGRFVTLPGYEWSGNTALGGDRNVFFTSEGRPIRRSSHALLCARHDIDLDCPTASDLFAALTAAGEDAICFAHCGGRYADIGLAHDVRLETAVEVHSSWGTFEWLLHDALRAGHRMGVVANSDGHKGRPGAEYPGASSFGAVGGLTCMLIPELTRAAVVDGLRRRHHYGTTGGPNGRLHLAVEARLAARLCDRDPALGGHSTRPVETLMMGDIAETGAGSAELDIEVSASCGIERLDLFNGLSPIETIRNYSEAELGNRLRVLMAGAAYRGRFRQVSWDGQAVFGGAQIKDTQPINFFNPDRVLARTGPQTLGWTLITTGNFGGFDVWFDDISKADVKLQTPLIKIEAPLGGLGLAEQSWSVDGPLPRTVSLCRLPDRPLAPDMRVNRRVPLHRGQDNAFYVRVTLEDGTQAWSSPIYLLRD